MTDVQCVGVVGAGTMGSGIAQVCAAAGLDVVLLDVSEAALERGVAAIAASLDKRVQKGALSAQEKQATLQRLQTTIRYEDLARVQIAIETATEQPQLKFELLRRMESALPSHALIGSNTSSISITQLAAALREPSHLVGLHFFNPVPAMALVEVIRGLQTSEDAYDRAMVFARALGKTPIPVANRPGFVVNRILIPMVNEAIFAVQERLGSVDDIDTAMQIGGGHPIGPLRLADVVGLDVVLAVMEVLQGSFGDNKYRPAFLLREMVQAGLLGRKTGQGFYKY
ncbi:MULTISPECIES: 3-hydroxyacyl-CoA dehydrogenase NAD-binding domain-containing protein [unclassified Variovorax]|uniref:3-hydroxyacyl-CoA dehydrogenase NAD-binding domain-containing protein n=1 Tax=unclassified Variovorax TaxID=663243 RepID=UPI0008B3BC8E|nr:MULTISPECIES: 3-hydroxyacyl-CoA dehydrogenase NAD-binding domain-containing protein [unclassified Variovorax]SEK13195.1 3-hydroxyacyl-CoA dehydrogenase [Variovorax sp. OK202]SFD87116.1 3-hydroxyacyl-CoA dehydrogenase [Variovorax sp. OK212]